MADRPSGEHLAGISGAIEGQQEKLDFAALERAHRDQIRRRTRHSRTRTAQTRLTAARQRDAIADARDVVARARDRSADARDLEFAQQDAADAREDDRCAISAADDPAGVARLRARAAKQRANAAEQRGNAAEDRQAAARDREQAAFERRHSLADSEIFARQLAGAETDTLTGARTQVAGLIDLDRELDRCRRLNAGLVVAYVETTGLESVDELSADAACDALLRRAVALTRAHLRSYDLIIRLGGDDFLCAMSNMSEPDARERFAQLNAQLAESADAGAITVGFAAFTRDETPTQLIARAESELTEARQDDEGLW